MYTRKTRDVITIDGMYYGEWSEENVIEFPKEQIPAEMQLEIGMELINVTVKICCSNENTRKNWFYLKAKIGRDFFLYSL